MTVRILSGDCRAVLGTLPSNSVQMVCTSPPYLGLRDYGTAQWDGGDLECDHLRGPLVSDRSGLRADGPEHVGPYAGEKAVTAGMPFAGTCGKCGARRTDAQIGLERTPAEYVAQLVEVFREVRRVLRDDGTVWLNLGDSYNNFRTQKGPGQAVHGRDELRGKPAPLSAGRGWAGFKEKDLMMIPARVALALQDDGWFLRSQMPWVKRSAMPESVEDRPASAVEYVYLLTKSARYYYDNEAIKREGTMKPQQRFTDGKGSKAQGYAAHRQPAGMTECSSRNFRNSDLFFDSLEPPHGAITDADGHMVALDVNPAAFADAHFATFSPRLIEPCIKAGTSERGCCVKCGAPWVRVVERSVAFTSGSGKAGNVPTGKYHGTEQAKSGTYDIRMGPSVSAVTTGWQPSCSCGAATVPCTVLDPFFGAGTTGLVSDRLGRDCIGVELNPDYADMARRRLVADAGMFAEIAD